MTYLGRFRAHDVPMKERTMTFTRCSQRRINLHHTQDGITSVSDAAAKALMQAQFPAGHRVSCDCMQSGGKMDAKDCKNLNVYDANGKGIAHFSVADFQAAQTDDGSIVIMRRPSATQDTNVSVPFPLFVPRAAGGMTLQRLNQIHQEFYRRDDQ